MSAVDHREVVLSPSRLVCGEAVSSRGVFRSQLPFPSKEFGVIEGIKQELHKSVEHYSIRSVKIHVKMLTCSLKQIGRKSEVKENSYQIWSISSKSNCLKHFTIYSLADLFNKTPLHLHWETFSHAAINTQRLHT